MGNTQAPLGVRGVLYRNTLLCRGILLIFDDFGGEVGGASISVIRGRVIGFLLWPTISTVKQEKAVHKLFICNYVLVFLVMVLGAGLARGDDRAVMPAYRVADGAIGIDGRLDEWPAAADHLRSAAGLDHTQSNSPQRGAWLGPVDASFSGQAAVDSDYLYVGATINDQFMINVGYPDRPWLGDDFEIFVDANPAESRFAAGLNANTKQFIFVPEHLWTGTQGTYVWRAKEYAGVKAVSRLTPIGYTIEVAIPKDLFPNWKAHHDLDSIGFDIECGDLDTPAAVGHDAGNKTYMFLLEAEQHFKSPAKLGLLKLDENPTPTIVGQAQPSTQSADYQSAQRILDGFDTDQLDPDLNGVLAEQGLARKAAMYVIWRRPELKADPAKLIAMLDEKPKEGQEGILCDPRAYAILALAERGQLPAEKVVENFAQCEELALRETAIYAVGLNGDKSAAPKLAALYPTATGLTQEYLAMTLAELGDPTGAATLKMSVKRDHGQWFGIRCGELLKQLGVN